MLSIRCEEDQFSPHAPPQQPPPISHGGCDAEDEADLPPIETIAAEKSFLCSVEPHCGQTTSSATSFALWYTSYVIPHSEQLYSKTGIGSISLIH